ncbi:MAG: 2-oxo acid dehydrogenase subunit E2, partial [Pirellula sp.]
QKPDEAQVSDLLFANRIVKHSRSNTIVLAKNNRLMPEDLEGGTFTISNGGIYGSLLSTPIVNPPQSGILGLHSIQERPVALNGQVVIRPMMYIALTYDHRIIDGREAVTFLKTIKEVIEDPARLFLEL